jgi:hypothetical protein
LANAKKYGWSFGIPLQNRIAIGYVYNDNFCTLEDIKSEVLDIFDVYNIIPSDITNSIKFNNSYYRKQNFTDRIVYVGNSSFFLEPLEATSFWIGDKIQRCAYDIWNNNLEIDKANNFYSNILQEAEVMIMLHYFASSIYKNSFWDFAIYRANECINRAMMNKKFVNMIEKSFVYNFDMTEDLNHELYSGWGPTSWHQNIEGLGLKNYFLKLKKEI